MRGKDLQLDPIVFPNSNVEIGGQENHVSMSLPYPSAGDVVIGDFLTIGTEGTSVHSTGDVVFNSLSLLLNNQVIVFSPGPGPACPELKLELWRTDPFTPLGYWPGDPNWHIIDVRSAVTPQDLYNAISVYVPDFTQLQVVGQSGDLASWTVSFQSTFYPGNGISVWLYNDQSQLVITGHQFTNGTQYGGAQNSVVLGRHVNLGPSVQKSIVIGSGDSDCALMQGEVDSIAIGSGITIGVVGGGNNNISIGKNLTTNDINHTVLMGSGVTISDYANTDYIIAIGDTISLASHNGAHDVLIGHDLYVQYHYQATIIGDFIHLSNSYQGVAIGQNISNLSTWTNLSVCIGNNINFTNEGNSNNVILSSNGGVSFREGAYNFIVNCNTNTVTMPYASFGNFIVNTEGGGGIATTHTPGNMFQHNFLLYSQWPPATDNDNLNNSVVLGSNISTQSSQSVALGYSNFIGWHSENSVIIGSGSTIDQNTSSGIAIGSTTHIGTGGNNACTIGKGRIGDNCSSAIVVGDAQIPSSSQTSTSIGYNIGWGSLSHIWSISIGSDNYIGNHSTGVVAIGTEATANDGVGYSDVIGRNSYIEEGNWFNTVIGPNNRSWAGNHNSTLIGSNLTSGNAGNSPVVNFDSLFSGSFTLTVTYTSGTVTKVCDVPYLYSVGYTGQGNAGGVFVSGYQSVDVGLSSHVGEYILSTSIQVTQAFASRTTLLIGGSHCDFWIYAGGGANFSAGDVDLTTVMGSPLVYTPPSPVLVQNTGFPFQISPRIYLVSTLANLSGYNVSIGDGDVIGVSTNYSIEVGTGNVIGAACTLANTFGSGNHVGDNCARTTLVGVSNYTFAGAAYIIGDQVVVLAGATSSIAMGYGFGGYTIGTNESNSIAIGSNNHIGTNGGTGGNYNIILGNGSSVGDTTQYATVLGTGSSVGSGTQWNFCVGGSVGDNSSGSVLIGYSNVIAHDTGACVAIGGFPGAGIAINFNAFGTVAVGPNIIVDENSAGSTVLGGGHRVGTTCYNAAILGNSCIIGNSSQYAIAIGMQTHVGTSSSNSIAVGTNTVIGNSSPNNVVIGASNAVGDTLTGCVVLGSGINASDVATGSDHSIVIGTNSHVAATSPYATILGDGVNVDTGVNDAIAIGRVSHVTGNYGVAIGAGASAGANAVVFGLIGAGGFSSFTISGLSLTTLSAIESPASGSTGITIAYNNGVSTSNKTVKGAVTPPVGSVLLYVDP